MFIKKINILKESSKFRHTLFRCRNFVIANDENVVFLLFCGHIVTDFYGEDGFRLD